MADDVGCARLDTMAMRRLLAADDLNLDNGDAYPFANDAPSRVNSHGFTQSAMTVWPTRRLSAATAWATAVPTRNPGRVAVIEVTGVLR